MFTPPETTTPSSPARSRLPLELRSVATVLACVVIVAGALAGVTYNLLGLPPLRDLPNLGDFYRLDLDVYRIGGQVFASGSPLYGSIPTTESGTSLPFTYPPIAAVLFSPLSAVSLYWAGLLVTTLSLALLVVTIVLTLRSLGYTPTSLMLWAAAAVFALSMILEPVSSTLDFGQINIVLMAFVAADCLLDKTPWPRGALIGLVAAVKLTPAVFILYFLLRKDFRAATIAAISFAAFTALGFVATFSDSVKYWTHTLIDSDRIGNPAYPGNQSITGVLARFGLHDSMRSAVWIVLACALLAVAAFAMRRAFATDHSALALGVNALFGLLVSPVSWSHHWVWAIPFAVALGTLAYRSRNAFAMAFVAFGVVLFYVAPQWRVADGRFSGIDWPILDQLAASSYVWWAIAAITMVAFVPKGHPAGAQTERGQLDPAVPSS